MLGSGWGRNDCFTVSVRAPLLSKLAWNNSLEFRRTSPTLLGLAQMLGMTDTQLDDLFAVAVQIVA